ncbi:MAG TPA: response regulator [Ktedonobacteraceae bacterium]|nr:response regulator [Ktedonobacteraceae bacterium]
MQYSSVSATALLAGNRPSLSVAENSIRTPYVLIVDDDAAIVDVIQFLLETEEYGGVGITDSLKILHFLDSLNDNLLPSVILLDLMMPGLSGYEIASALAQNERYRHIPIIIMTADSRVQSVSGIQGAIDYVAKPFHLDPLLAKLKVYLDPPPR